MITKYDFWKIVTRKHVIKNACANSPALSREQSLVQIEHLESHEPNLYKIYSPQSQNLSPIQNVTPTG